MTILLSYLGTQLSYLGTQLSYPGDQGNWQAIHRKQCYFRTSNFKLNVHISRGKPIKHNAYNTFISYHTFIFHWEEQV